MVDTVMFRVLGPLSVERGGEELTVRGPRRRRVLAVLVVEAGKTVPIERLIDCIWGDRPPKTARTVVHGHIAALRRAVGGDLIETGDDGYRLAIDPDHVDAVRFERLVTEATRGAGERRRALLAEAMSLWRGDPLVDVDDGRFAAADIARWQELRIEALEAEIDARLEAGDATQVIGELAGLVKAHPLRERLWGQLMLALYRTGRQADALRAYQQARQVLASELGIDPGHELTTLEQQILEHDPALQRLDLQRGQSHVRVFLFTDIEGSTRLWGADPVGMPHLLARHNELVRTVVAGHGGRVFKFTGDGCGAVFAEPSAAVEAAAELHRSMVDLGLSVRAAIDIGPAVDVGSDFVGFTLNRCCRVMALAHGGQVLVAGTAEPLARAALPADLGLIDLGEHAIRDLDEPMRLFQVTGEGLQRQFPPLRDAVVPTSLPRARSSLVGRGDVIAELSGLIVAAPLVTLAAVGGSGKTRVALEVAHRLRDSFAHGAAFVDLAPLRDPALVPDAVAQAVGMPPSETPLSGADITRFLGARNILVVLDNCEHVLEAAADIADAVLAECPATRMLATSREPLGLEGETLVRLTGLDPEESAALFLERAALAPSTTDTSVITDICARLDGLPLAIELAAAHARHLPLDDVGALLEDRFRSLGATVRTAQRHRTLETMMDWSYELLDDDAKALLRRLSVFAGSFTVEAVDAVWNEPGDSKPTVVTRLGELVDKSLVVLEPDSTRLSLLETVRLYAADKLRTEGEGRDAHQRLASWLVDTAPGPWWWARTPEVARSETELENVRAALEWCHSAGEVRLLTRLVVSYGAVWFLTTRAAEAHRWLRTAAQHDADLDLDLRLAWRTVAAWCHVVAMEGPAAMALADEALQLAPNDHAAVAPLRCLRGWMVSWSDASAGHQDFELTRATSHDTTLWQTNADYFEGYTALRESRFEEALGLFRSAARSDACIHPNYPLLAAAVCLHFLDRADEARAALDAARRSAGDDRWYFLDLTVPFVAMLLATASDDLGVARGHLGVCIERTHDRYPHLTSAWGYAAQGAIVIAHLAGDHREAVTLYEGARSHGLHRRWEGATVAGRSHGKRAMSTLGDRSDPSVQRGRSLTLAELTSLAEAYSDRDDRSRGGDAVNRR